MLQPGDRIGRFEIQRRLGRGGMATVYVAHDPNLGRLVALKMFEGDLDGSEAGEKFLREARAAASLSHPHIVTIHDFGEFTSQPYIVMEYLQGDTLAALIKRREPLPLAERLRLLEEICAGVAYAHGFDVIHRDIKPANLLRLHTGRLKILDFGIARTLGTSMSRGTALVGTPGYMAPEQIHGGEIDRRADLFAVGVVAYELLSYAEAFSGDSLPAISHRVLNHHPAPLTSLDPAIPAALAAVVEKALKKSPSERYSDAESMRADFEQIRRQVPNTPLFDAPTMVVPRTQPIDRGSGSGRGSRGSGSGHDPRPSDAPHRPSPGRPSREEIQQRRQAQMAASLAQARTLLDESRLDAALEACMNALALDESHAPALELEQEIRLALDREQAVALVAEAGRELSRGRLTVAQEHLERARELDPEAPEMRQTERALRLARAEQAGARQRAEVVRQMLDAAEAALTRGDIESALASAQQAVRLDPANDLAREMEAEAHRRLNKEAGLDDPAPPAPGPAAGPTPEKNRSHDKREKTPQPQPVTSSSWQATLREALGGAGASWQRVQVRAAGGWTAVRGAAQRAASSMSAGAVRGAKAAARASSATARPTWLPWATGGVLVAIALAAVLLWPRPSPAPVLAKTGTVTIDAQPWATVKAIVAEDGSPQTLPPDAVTPLSLELPPGTYRVTLAGPLADSPQQEVQLAVVSDQASVSPEVRFTPLTAEAYFEPYLASRPEVAAGPPAGAP